VTASNSSYANATSLIGVVSVACVAVTLCLVRGPLFQRATPVTTIQRQLDNFTTLNVAYELPYRYLVRNKYLWYDTPYSSHLHAITINASTGAPLKLGYTGCDGECYTTVNVRDLSFSLAIYHFAPPSRLPYRV
jgi:hypothetical protein